MDLPTKLEKKEIWHVYDCGIHIGFFTDLEKAEKIAMEKGGKINNQFVWLGNDGKYYDTSEFLEIYVDLPDRKEVLAKLTEQERRVLGIE